MQQNDVFKTASYSFVAGAILTGKITSCSAHVYPSNPRQTMFHLQPATVAEELYQQYLRDELKFSIRQMSQAIRDLKNLPVEREGIYENPKN
jgi:hypothetical protein